MVGLIVVVIIAGVALGWLGSRASKTPTPEPRTANLTQTPPEPVVVHEDSTKASPKTLNPQAVLPRTNQTLGSTTSVASANQITNWEERLEQILAPEGKESDKAKQLLAIFPRVPSEGQAELAQHLCNLTSDQDYGPLGQYLTNSAMSESVLDVLMNDLLNRPNSVKLPYLLGIARQEQNPKAGDAKDLLELFLEENDGNDWAKWQAKMDQWLKDNPD
ncbi:MAG: hypothetical protein C5B50_08155 [Verrucomicrobia bacterium]|nr:MAG: hypothetical protein C5B50_08155 [Verrucomicrobiota bacterium]